MTNIAVVILTYNEEIHIRSSIEAVSRIRPTPEIFIIDSGSSDRTQQISRDCGATVLENKFINYAKQFTWAIDNIQTSADWVMRLDADEIVSEELADELTILIPELSEDVTGIYLLRRHVFNGTPILHGGRFPLKLLRIWRSGTAKIEDRWMDEHMVLSRGSTITAKGTFDDVNLKGLSFFIEKHNGYATREALDVILERHQLGGNEITVKDQPGRFTQDRMKRMLKQKVFYRIPYPLAATLYFSLRYFAQRGFLDGASGLEYHFLQGFWYRFLVGAKVREFDAEISPSWTANEKLRYLAFKSGYSIEALGGERRTIETEQQ
ncbi:glycosyltransferase [Rhodococcus sp. MALMAid1271]|uniref:glycosyltransferase n=1 Tax=Rhodococcus sp. MALMAid1271 TaxID=3411744 RepID=UPI003BA1AB91